MVDNYKGKTPQQVWDEWTPNQRYHFLTDHLLGDYSSSGKYNTQLSELSYNEVKIEPGLVGKLHTHIQRGQYSGGGGVGTATAQASASASPAESHTPKETTPMKLVTFTKKNNPAIKIIVKVYPSMSIYQIDNSHNIRFPYVVGQVLNMGHRVWACNNGWLVNDEDPCPEKKIFGMRAKDIPEGHPLRHIYPSKFRADGGTTGNVDAFKGSIEHNGKTLEYQVNYDWDLGMNGEWELPEINFNGEDIREYDLGFSDDDIKDIEKAILKEIKKENPRYKYLKNGGLFRMNVEPHHRFDIKQVDDYWVITDKGNVLDNDYTRYFTGYNNKFDNKRKAEIVLSDMESELGKKRINGGGVGKIFAKGGPIVPLTGTTSRDKIVEIEKLIMDRIDKQGGYGQVKAKIITTDKSMDTIERYSKAQGGNSILQMMHGKKRYGKMLYNVINNPDKIVSVQFYDETKRTYADELVTAQKYLLKNRHPNLWDDLAKDYSFTEAQVDNFRRDTDHLSHYEAWQKASDYGLPKIEGHKTITMQSAGMPEYAQKSLKDAIDQKKSYRFHWDCGWDCSVSVEMGTDGILRGWFSQEYRGTGNGHYWLLISPTQAIFAEND